MIPTNYEEKKQWIEVRSISLLPIEPFSPCLLITSKGEAGGPVAVSAVNDRSVDENYQGENYLIAVSGSARIPAKGYGRVSIDWPIVARVNANRLVRYGELTPELLLEPSETGVGFSIRLPLTEDYPFPLGYWQDVDKSQLREWTGFAITAYLDEDLEVKKELAEKGWTLALVGPIGHPSIGNADYVVDYYYSDYARQIGDRMHLGHLERIEEGYNLSDLQQIDEPTARVEELTSAGLGRIRSAFYLGAAHLASQWPRIVLQRYGTYELEIAAVLKPVDKFIPLSSDLYSGFGAIASRFKDGQQELGRPDSLDDWWAWSYEDFVLLINRYDYDVAVSRCHLEVVEHRMPLEVRSLFLAKDSDFAVLRHAYKEIGGGNFGTYVGFARVIDGAWIISYTTASAVTLYADSSVHGGAFEDAWPEEEEFPLIEPDGPLAISTPWTLEVPWLDVFNRGNFDYTSYRPELGYSGGGPLPWTFRTAVKVGRPEKMGVYTGRAKTVLEFRMYSRCGAELTTASQWAAVWVQMDQTSYEVDTIGTE